MFFGPKFLVVFPNRLPRQGVSIFVFCHSVLQTCVLVNILANVWAKPR
eukprot:UN21225